MQQTDIKNCHDFLRLISDQILKLLFRSWYINLVKLLAQKSKLFKVQHHKSIKNNPFEPCRLRFHRSNLGWWWGFLGRNFNWLKNRWRTPWSKNWWWAPCHLNSCWLSWLGQSYYDARIFMVWLSLLWPRVSVWHSCLDVTGAAASAESPLISLNSAGF